MVNGGVIMGIKEAGMVRMGMLEGTIMEVDGVKIIIIKVLEDQEVGEMVDNRILVVILIIMHGINQMIKMNKIMIMGDEIKTKVMSIMLNKKNTIISIKSPYFITL